MSSSWGFNHVKKKDTHHQVVVIVLIFGFSCCSGVTHHLRDARLVVSGEGGTSSGATTSDRVSGVGEVVRVDGEELERLRENVSKHGNVTLANNDETRTRSSVSGGAVDDGHAGVPDAAGVVAGSLQHDNTPNETLPLLELNPVVVAVQPEDSSRGSTSSQGGIDRRKVAGGGMSNGVGAGKPDTGQGASGNSEISFTGILNGLLDSFINDSPPPRPAARPQPQSTTTSQPSLEEASVEHEEEEDDEEEQPSEEKPKKSSLKPTPEPSVSGIQTTEELSNEEVNVSEEPLEEDEDPQDDYPVAQSNVTNKVTKVCEGECRNILFGIFLCDEIDNDAFCPENGLACCVNKPETSEYRPYGNVSSSSEEDIILDNPHDLPPRLEQELADSDDENLDEEDLEDPEPVQQSSSENKQKASLPNIPPTPTPNKYMHRVPPPLPPNHHHQYPFAHPQNIKNQPGMIMHYPPPPRPMPLPCPRYCVKNYLDTYCPDRLPSQFGCGVDAFCCGSPVEPPPYVERENDEKDGTGDDDQDPEEETSKVKKILGPCTEEVGSCVNKNIINIICFSHAAPTEMYTCPRTTLMCCARKTALPKDSLPSSTPPPPPKLENTITRNSSSQNYPKPQPPPPQQQQQQPQPAIVLPQFAPPSHHHSYPAQQPFHQPPPTHAPTPPPLAETPPPPIGIPATQFTNPFPSNAIAPTQSRVPSRQPVGQYVCGVKGAPSVKTRRKKRVVGGSDSSPGEWCWQVALINSLNQYLCGGALIGTQWVLTAAHCVTNIIRSGDAIYVRVGDHDLTSRYGSPGAQTLRVATTYIHHNHNSQTLDNDIALLKLQGNAALKEGVCLVCLPSRNHMSETPGKWCTVTGYGYMGESGPIPLRIRQALLPIVSDDECVRKVNAVTEKVFALPMSSFCAGGDKSGHDACQGDGGGPLVCRADDPSTGDTGTGYYELTGLVSWGFGCGRDNVPGVYVKVSSFIGWIHQVIRSN